MRYVFMLLAPMLCIANSGAGSTQEKPEGKPREARAQDKSEEKAGDEGVGYIEASDAGSTSREAKVEAIRNEFKAFSGLRYTPAGTTRITEWERMSAEERQELESFISCFFHAVWVELKASQKENPAFYDSQMSRLAPELVPLIDRLVDKKDYTIFQIKEKQLTYELQKLQSEYLRETNVRNKERIAKEIARRLGERIDVQQEKRRLDLKRLEPRIEALRSMIEEVDQNRDALIKRDQDAFLNPTGKSPDSKEISPRKNKEEN